MKMKFVLMLVAVSLTAGSAMALTVADPGFEDAGDYSAGGYVYMGNDQSVTPWINSSGGAAWIFGAGYTTGAHKPDPASGNNLLEINGGWIYQDIDVVGDQEYDITASIAGRYAGEGIEAYVANAVGGAYLGYIYAFDITTGNVEGEASDWATATWNFTAADTSTQRLYFRGGGESWMDDVAVTEVPEPITLGLLGLGGLFLRRKKR